MTRNLIQNTGAITFGQKVSKTVTQKQINMHFEDMLQQGHIDLAEKAIWR